MKHHMPDVHSSHPNVTPLIDIVMCLIIFFMLVAKIGVTTGADEISDLPTSIRGTDIKDMGNALVLNIYDKGGAEPQVTALVKGEGNVPLKQELRLAPGPANLQAALEFYRWGADRKHNTDDDNADFKVVINSGGDVQYRLLQPILTSCAQAGVKSVNFKTKIEEVRSEK